MRRTTQPPTLASMRVASLLTFKGGVGKTTTALNLAAEWAGERTVLLIDLDPQHNTTTSLAAHITHHGRSVDEVLTDAANDPDYRLSITELSQVVFPDGSGLYLLGSQSAPQLAAVDLLLASRPGGETALKRALSGLEGSGIDGAIIDTSPSESRLTWNTVAASTAVFGVATPDLWEVRGAAAAETFVHDTAQFGVTDARWGGVIMNQVEGKRTKVSKVMMEVAEQSGLSVLTPVVPRSVQMRNSALVGVPVVLNEPKCAAAKAFRDIAAQVWKASKVKKAKKGQIA